MAPIRESVCRAALCFRKFGRCLFALTKAAQLVPSLLMSLCLYCYVVLTIASLLAVIPVILLTRKVTARDSGIFCCYCDYMTAILSVAFLQYFD